MHIQEEAWVEEKWGKGPRSSSLTRLKSGGSAPFCPEPGWGGLSSSRTQTLLCIALKEELGLYFIPTLLFDCFFSVPAFLCLLKIINFTTTCSGMSFVSRLRSKKWLRPKWFLLCQEKFSFSRAPQYICLHSDFILYVRASTQLGIESRLEGQILSNDWLMAECRVGKVHRDRKKEC